MNPMIRTNDRTTRGLARVCGFVDDEAGSGTISSLYWAISILVMSGIALDGSNAFRERNLLQTTADAVALAAAAHIEDPETGRSVALQVADMNLGAGNSAITSSDIKYGIYTAATNTFIETDVEPNTVLVSAQRNGARNNSLGLLLLQFIGADKWNLQASSLAVFHENEVEKDAACSGATIISGGGLRIGGSNILYGEVCLHGQDEFFSGGGTYYSAETQISSHSLANITPGSTTSYNGEPSANPADIMKEKDVDLEVVPYLSSMYAQLEAELVGNHGQAYTGTTLPPHFLGATIVEVNGYKELRQEEPKNGFRHNQVEMQSDHIYYVPQGFGMGGNYDLERVAIIAPNKTWMNTGNSTFTDSFFFIRDGVGIPSSMDFGRSEIFCDGEYFNTYVFSAQKVQFAGGGQLWGAMIAAPEVHFGGGWDAAGGLYVEADPSQGNGDLQLGGNQFISGCPSARVNHPNMPIGTAKPKTTNTSDGVKAARIVR